MDQIFILNKEAKMYKRILCPIDGSPTSNAGMIESIKLAKDQHANLLFLHVIDTYFPILGASEAFDRSEIDEIIRNNGKKVLKVAEENAKEADIKADVKMVDTFGSGVATIIVQHAEEWAADLIVIGTHGLRGIERLVMGSDAETVLRKSPVPVLVVKKHKAH